MILWDLVRRARDFYNESTVDVQLMLDPLDYDSKEFRNVQSAVRRYSKDSPLSRRVEVSTDGDTINLSALSVTWDANDPTPWGRDWNVKRVQMDLDDGKETFLHPNDYRLYQNPAGQHVIKLVRGGISSPCAIWYERPHKFVAPYDDDDHFSAPDSDLDPLAKLVASIVLMQLSISYAQKTSDSSLSPTIDFSRMSSTTKARASDLEAQYTKEIERQPAESDGGWVSWETGTDWGGPWILHGRGNRGWL